MTGVDDADTGRTAAQAFPAAHDGQPLDELAFLPSHRAGISGRSTTTAAATAAIDTSTSCHVASMRYSIPRKCRPWNVKKAITYASVDM